MAKRSKVQLFPSKRIRGLLREIRMRCINSLFTFDILTLMEPRLTYTGCHLPYGITQCYLPPDTSEHIPP